MKIPRNLSGHELAAALCRRWRCEKVNQVGSHIILRANKPAPHRVAVPAHRVLRVGTLNGITGDVANHKGS
jgi:predicted RNA binding protein YcfA (HicA-like mRNA interferase family)